ncbi:peptide chain release factor-like protein [Jannaschia pohangensis]|uniref:Peptide chain release factor n=1 Tax=Jannaschia pohangensis TaxID=390807 RepID=A0A1I3GEV2_9RHOB|nr:peptide chain release factor-like protein [Jannaschia pohangensis]SFI21701.1 peptide chain release factor [Jannaschia pohangensis]
MSIATLLVSAGNGPAECRMAVGYLIPVIEAAASASGLAMDVAARAAPHGPSSAILTLTGAGAEPFARNWTGPVLWQCPSPLRPAYRRKSWFVQVFALPHGPSQVRIDPAEVQMQAMRASGPGGQHVNKTDSAIRARWRDPGGQEYVVVVRGSRSQHQNRKAALDRLAALVTADLTEAEASRQGRAHRLHQSVQRGAAQRTFSGPDFRPA